MQVAEMPSPSYIYPKFWGVAASDSLYPSPSQSSSPDHVALYLHSSGSTGLPKVVPHTNRTTGSWAAFSMFTIMIHTHSYHLLAAISAGKGLVIHAPHRYATMALPPAHGLAYFGNTILGIYCGLTMGLYPPTGSSLGTFPTVPTAENFLEHVKRTKCTGIITSPIFLKAWARSAADVEELRKLGHVVRLSTFLRVVDYRSHYSDIRWGSITYRNRGSSCGGRGKLAVVLRSNRIRDYDKTFSTTRQRERLRMA
jgi:acyl-coenzyme A synthetase/AMP-(fatty) acid ligase